jgi:hypothetical protein
MTLIARFPGTPCAECDESIHVGDEIEGADPGWKHTTCPDPLASSNPVCPECFLTHPEGKCDR